MKVTFQGQTATLPVNYNNPYPKAYKQTDNQIKTNIIDFPYADMYLALAGTHRYSRTPNFQYENYSNSEKLFRENLKNGLPLFGEETNVPYLLSNDNIRRNLIEFLAKYAQEELDKTKLSGLNNEQQVEKIQSLTEVRDFFSEFKDAFPPKDEIQQLSFAGEITRKDEKISKNIVHAYSAACALVSAAWGEGAAFGADTATLRVLQFAMFSTLALYLKVPPLPSLEYYTKEMFAGATLGVGGAKLITSWLGIGAHTASAATGLSVVTGGGANAAITGGVRAVNGTLSALITEKMGRGYVNRVKNDQMTLAFQTFETLAYFVGRGILTHENPFSQLFHVDFADTSSPEMIKDALEKIPAASRDAFGTFLELSKEFGTRTGVYFTTGIAQDLLFMKDRSPEKLKQHIAPIFKNAIIGAVVYQICDFTIGQEITKETTETIKDIQENLEQYPDVYKKFINLEHEFYEQIHLKDLSDKDFVEQFKNKVFVNSFANWSNYAVSELAEAWRNRKNEIQAQKMFEMAQGLQTEKNKSAEIKKQFTPKEKEELANSISKFNKILEQQKQFLELKDNFGYGRIGGYLDVKELLTKKFILPVSLENTDLCMNVPPAILFYGPTGVGKTELTKALAEQAKCLIPRYIPSDDKEELKEELYEKVKTALENYETKGRRTVLRIDEFDDYGNNPETANVFANFIKGCSDNKITLMLTTNNPLDIQENISKQVIKIPILPPDENNAVEVMQFYLKGKVDDNFDFKAASNSLFKEGQAGMYSNSQIKALCEKAYKDSIKNKTGINMQNMLELTKKMPPEIDSQALEKFKSEMLQLK